MKVRGWLIVGPRPQTGMLGPVEGISQHLAVPDASNFPTGSIIEWFPSPGTGITPVVLVCVEIPL